jgi:hypothetical protein
LLKQDSQCDLVGHSSSQRETTILTACHRGYIGFEFLCAGIFPEHIIVKCCFDEGVQQLSAGNCVSIGCGEINKGLAKMASIQY